MSVPMATNARVLSLKYYNVSYLTCKHLKIECIVPHYCCTFKLTPLTGELNACLLCDVASTSKYIQKSWQVSINKINGSNFIISKPALD